MQWIALCLPVCILVLCIPLFLGRVAPNGYYGFRTAKTMETPALWYAANRMAAMNSMVCSVIGFALALVLLREPTVHRFLASMLGTTVLQGIAVVRSLIRLTDL